MSSKLIYVFMVQLVIFYVGSALCAAPRVIDSAMQRRQNEALEKTPRSIFLLKRAKLNSEAGGPRFSPSEAQLRMIINDSSLRNIKKFE